MAKAFMCDACGEFIADEPFVVTLAPPNTSKDSSIVVDLCPFCYNVVLDVLNNAYTVIERETD